jgi:hypothetical protein
MSEPRTLRFLRVGPVHDRVPKPSRIELDIMPADRKTDRVDTFTLTEDQALSLAQMALHTYAVIRDLRHQREALAEADRLDRKGQP